MKTIPVGKEYFALVDDEDYEQLSKYNWFAKPATMKDGRVQVYAHRSIWFGGGKRGTAMMHRDILGCGGSVDHRDGNGLNNQRYNLRPATHAQNMSNRYKTKGLSSQYKGVSWAERQKKWRAAIRHNKQRHDLGYFREEFDAATVYNFFAHELHGEFARYNLPTEAKQP